MIAFQQYLQKHLLLANHATFGCFLLHIDHVSPADFLIGIQINAVLYHIDLPRVLEEEYGGWVSPKIM